MTYRLRPSRVLPGATVAECLRCSYSVLSTEEAAERAAIEHDRTAHAFDEVSEP